SLKGVVLGKRSRDRGGATERAGRAGSGAVSSRYRRPCREGRTSPSTGTPGPRRLKTVEFRLIAPEGARGHALLEQLHLQGAGLRPGGLLDRRLGLADDGILCVRLAVHRSLPLGDFTDRNSIRLRLSGAILSPRRGSGSQRDSTRDVNCLTFGSCNLSKFWP